MIVILGLCLALHASACVLLRRSARISRVLSLALICLAAMWYILPGLVLLVYPYEDLALFKLAGMTESAFLASYVTESVALWCIIGLLVYMPRMAKSRGGETSQTWLPSRQMTLVIAAAYAMVVVSNAAAAHFNYLDNNDVTLAADKSMSVLELVGDLLRSACMAVVIFQRKWTPATTIAVALVSVDAVLEVLGGARFMLITPVVLLFLRYFSMRRVDLSRVAAAAITLPVLALVVMPITIVIGEMRQQGAFVASDVVDRAGQDGESGSTKRMAVELFNKLDSFSTGAVLTTEGQVTGMGTAGIKPYVGAALNFIPRSVWPSRPVAGSIDGTIYGHPSRVVARAILGARAIFLNVGVAPLHISFWELGWLGFPVFIAAGYFFLIYVNSKLCAATLIDRTVGVYLLFLPNFAFLLPSPDIMLTKFVVATGVLLAVQPLGYAWRQWHLGVART